LLRKRKRSETGFIFLSPTQILSSAAGNLTGAHQKGDGGELATEWEKQLCIPPEAAVLAKGGPAAVATGDRIQLRPQLFH